MDGNSRVTNVFGDIVNKHYTDKKIEEYEKLIENNVGSKIERTSKGKKNISRRTFMKYFLATMGGVAVAIIGPKVVEKGSRALNLSKAVDYMNEVKFKEYFKRLEIDYSTKDFLMWSKVNIPSDNLAIMQNLIDFLIEDGFTETEAWYAISASFGNDGLSLVANLYGKDNIEDFLISNGYFTTREDGTKKASAVLLENYCEKDYVNIVNDIKERKEKNEKGMGL